MRKFYKTTIQVIVLSEDYPLEWHDLHDVQYSIEQECVGDISEIGRELITPKQCADLLYEFRSDPNFFGLDADGNDIEI